MHQWFAGLARPGRRSGRPVGSIVSRRVFMELWKTYRHDCLGFPIKLVIGVQRELLLRSCESRAEELNAVTLMV